MSDIDDGGLAFPGTRSQQVGNMSDHTGDPNDDMPTYADVSHPGMTLRDWFAGQALAGLLSTYTTDEVAWEKVSRRAYGLADAMIQARKAKT